ncbi:hypothetical protein FZI91_16635 [Mycobacterium sp. CBMA271]|uniref:hypothetical protein n=1 Tax=unclassified Mycobacteroides TaxID=2618759 RepID=UPI0012DBDE05|nr:MULTISPECIES: hypothetical protein [unclassified Mycobacteroides]MUM17079.1 hypothetical protein [Mycobacteroides sp. CBMA 326]MUM23317.1 hypothetical protein [Mycobacteroides sp. CBMA 271]
MDARTTGTETTMNFAAIAQAVTAAIHTGDRGKDEFLAYVDRVLPLGDIWSAPARRGAGS